MTDEAARWVLVSHAALALLIHVCAVMGKSKWKSRLMSGLDVLSLSLIMSGFIATFVLVVLLFAAPDSVDWASWSFNPWLSCAGIPFLAAQLVLLALSHTGLGDSWAGGCTIHDDHELITSGIYAYIRHPMYTGVLLWLPGALLVSHNALFSCLLASVIGVVIRVGREERLLDERFGEEWRTYRDRTRMLL